MRARAALRLAGALGLWGASAWAQSRAPAPFARVVSRELPTATAAEAGDLADLDGDGIDDFVLAGRTIGQDYARCTLVYRGARDGSLTGPERFELTPDVTAWCAADVHPDAGREVVLLTANAAFALRTGAPEGERFARLFACRTLWQLPQPRLVPYVPELARDVDGDGLDDLVVPEPGGWSVHLQRRGESGATFERESVLRVPPEESDWEGLGPELAGSAAVSGGSRGSRLSFSVSLSGEEERSGEADTLLAVVESAPAPQWVDWDGDRKLDLVAQSSERLHVWLQGADGALTRDPTGSFTLPVLADRTRRLDASYGSKVFDLDADGRGDVLIFAGDARASDVRTQMLAFTSRGAKSDGARNPFGERGLPQDLMVLAGFVASNEFIDIDGDQRLELVAHTVRPDLIDALRSAASETFDADMNVYKNEGGRLSKRPDLTWRYTLPIKAFTPLVKFVGDVTGDGLADLLVRDQPDRVRLYMLRGQGAGWTVLDKPVWELSVDRSASLRLARASGRSARDLLILEPARVVQVRFGK